MQCSAKISDCRENTIFEGVHRIRGAINGEDTPDNFAIGQRLGWNGLATVWTGKHLAPAVTIVMLAANGDLGTTQANPYVIPPGHCGHRPHHLVLVSPPAVEHDQQGIRIVWFITLGHEPGFNQGVCADRRLNRGDRPLFAAHRPDPRSILMTAGLGRESPVSAPGHHCQSIATKTAIFNKLPETKVEFLKFFRDSSKLGQFIWDSTDCMAPQRVAAIKWTADFVANVRVSRPNSAYLTLVDGLKTLSRWARGTALALTAKCALDATT